MTKQIKSKERVAEHGEVFTAEREVKAMCDLVSTQCDNVDATFLEPACGDGNFLADKKIRKRGFPDVRSARDCDKCVFSHFFLPYICKRFGNKPRFQAFS